MPPVPLFSALADETRCIIIEMLRVEPLPVHRLAEAFAISRPAISRHLRVLNEAGLVFERKRGRENIYALRIEALEPCGAWLTQFAPLKAVPAEPAVNKPKVVRPKAAQPRPAKPLVPKSTKSETPPAMRVTQMEFDL